MFRLSIALLLLSPAMLLAQPVAKPAVVELFEDDADGLIRQLNNDGGLDTTDDCAPRRREEGAM